MRSNIKIEFYKDKVRITSPGGLFKATLDEILSGIQTYRNKRLVHLLDKLGLIENFGTGIQKTIDSYKSESKHPEFNPLENFFIVTLPNLNYNDQINGQINELGLEILKVIQQIPGINTNKIFTILNQKISQISIEMIRNTIKRNIKNYIELKGSRKIGGYFIKK